jgi:signal transduction histidine kinase
MAFKMNDIIDELLLLSQVRQSEVQLQPLDMAEIINETRQRLADMIKESQGNIIVPNKWPAALGYAGWVEEVWVNYISNALKYGNKPPYVELGATPLQDGMIRFWVRDNGPGLSPEQQAKLFTPFTQLSPIRATGYGLGLSIVARIMDKLGGQVGVESEGIAGRGSLFYFTLPALPGGSYN